MPPLAPCPPVGLVFTDRAPGGLRRADALNASWRAAPAPWTAFLPGGGDTLLAQVREAPPGTDVLCPGGLPGGGLPPLLGEPFLVRRSLLERLGGFRTLPAGLEILDLGLRLWEAGARFHALPGTGRVCPVPGAGDLLALLYRHPCAWFEEWLVRCAGAGDVRRALSRPFPASFRLTAAQLGDYVSRMFSPPLRTCAQVVADLEGQDCLRAQGCYDRRLSENWLRTRTPLFEAEAARDLVVTHPPPRLLGGPAAPPLEVRLEGRMEVEVSAELLAGLRDPRLCIPLPVECPEQTGVELYDFDPPDFEAFVQAGHAARLPLRSAASVGFSFRCRVREGGLTPAGSGGSRSAIPLSARYGARLEEMLEAVFGGAAPDPRPRARARRIYDWICRHVPARANDRMGPLPLDALAGNCYQRVRLFTLLGERTGLQVRERAGALAVCRGEEGGHGRERWVKVSGLERGHPSVHTWGEVFLEGEGWLPFDFLASDMGIRTATEQNLRDADLRRHLEAWTPLADDYYFGHVDPYRCHFGGMPPHLAGIPSGSPEGDLEALWNLAWGTRHRLELTVRGLPERLWPGPAARLGTDGVHGAGGA